jgi:hypothetical protein
MLCDYIKFYKYQGGRPFYSCRLTSRERVRPSLTSKQTDDDIVMLT